MLSGILNSPRAVQVNIAIMRAFMRMRQILADHRGLARRLDALERRLVDHDAALGEQGKEIRAVFNAIQQLLEPPSDERQTIGFKFKPPKGG